MPVTFLYDITKGTSSGTLVIPPKGICLAGGIHYYIEIGFREKVLIYCKIQGRYRVPLRQKPSLVSGDI